jgi:hypothetical protein
LTRKSGREVVARCLSKANADDATVWLLDRLSRFAPEDRCHSTEAALPAAAGLNINAHLPRQPRHRYATSLTVTLPVPPSITSTPGHPSSSSLPP